MMPVGQALANAGQGPERSRARQGLAERQSLFASDASGQVLPLGLLLCALGALAWVLSLNLGRLVHNKASLLRATDAAVYSAAVVQARALNLHAYLNRAQLAQQVAMAHLITTASAERYRATLAQQASRFNPPATLIGFLFAPQHAVAYLSAKAGGVTDSVALGQLAQAFARHDEVIHQVLERVRHEQLKRLVAVRQHVLTDVLVKNVGASGSSLKGTSTEALGLEANLVIDELPGFISRFSGSDARWQALLKRASKKYGFLDDRNQTTRNLWAVNIKCPHKRHELRRKGSTRVSAKGEWSVQDNQSYHALRYNRWIGCYQREYPMGWALVSNTIRQRPTQNDDERLNATPQNFSQQAFWRWVGEQAQGGWNIFSGGDNHLARLWAKQAELRWATQGLPSYTALTPKRGASLRLGLVVKQQSALVHAGTPVEERRFAATFSPTATERIQALHSRAAAETYFEAPSSRLLGSTAAPNLFQPFWKARLIDYSALPVQSKAP